MPTEPSENPGQLPDLDLRRRVAQSQGVVNIQEDRLGQLYGRWPGGDYVSIPAYELDIAAAWGLWPELMLAEGGWTLTPQNDGSWHIHNVWEGIELEGKSAPRAICLAYLAWRASQ